MGKLATAVLLVGVLVTAPAAELIQSIRAELSKL